MKNNIHHPFLSDDAFDEIRKTTTASTTRDRVKRDASTSRKALGIWGIDVGLIIALHNWELHSDLVIPIKSSVCRLWAVLQGHHLCAVCAVNDRVDRKTLPPPRQRCGDLSVLFAEAEVLKPLFDELIHKLSQGLVSEKITFGIRCKGREFTKTVCNPANPRIKGWDRAVQKLWRSYRGDARLLRDIVRNSVVFDDLSAMIEFLRRMIKCQETSGNICVVQVKDDLTHNPKTGYVLLRHSDRVYVVLPAQVTGLLNSHH